MKRNLMAAIAAISALGFAMGITYPLLALQLDARDFSAAMIGLSTASQPLGTISALAATPQLTRRFGAKPVALVCAVVTAAVLTIYPVYTGFWTWCILRFAQGLAFSVLFAISEAWVVEFAEGPYRSRILSLYMSAFAASLAAGPLLVAVVGSSGMLPFLLGAGIVLLVTMPIALIRSDKPIDVATPHVPVMGIVRRNPVLILAVAVFAITEIVSLSLLPVFGKSAGLGEARAALLASAFVAGPILLQYPLGWLADHSVKRPLLIGTAALSYVGYVLLPIVLHHVAVWPLLALLGAATASLYTIALAVLGERYRGADLVAGTAVFSAVYGMGSLAGSGASGVAMFALGTEALPYVLGAVLVGLAVIAAVCEV